jgi:uncharacterized protein (TIGR02284 family)
MATNKAIEVMNDMLQLDLDAILAYDEAIHACDVDEIKTRLREFRGDHERHVRDLSLAVRTYGGQPKEKRDIKGFFIQGFTKMMSRGDRSALMTMRANEELTNRSYAAALKHELPHEVRTLLEQNYNDERRHLQWIKDAISRSAWEIERPSAHP